jgi:hypothetical protein
MVLMGYSGARGTLMYEKNLKAKILCQTPLNTPLGDLVKKWITANNHGSFAWLLPLEGPGR